MVEHGTLLHLPPLPGQHPWCSVAQVAVNRAYVVPDQGERLLQIEAIQGRGDPGMRLHGGMVQRALALARGGHASAESLCRHRERSV